MIRNQEQDLKIKLQMQNQTHSQICTLKKPQLSFSKLQKNRTLQLCIKQRSESTFSEKYFAFLRNFQNNENVIINF